MLLRCLSESVLWRVQPPIWPGAIEMPVKILNCTPARTMYSCEYFKPLSTGGLGRAWTVDGSENREGGRVLLVSGAPGGQARPKFGMGFCSTSCLDRFYPESMLGKRKEYFGEYERANARGLKHEDYGWHGGQFNRWSAQRRSFFG